MTAHEKLTMCVIDKMECYYNSGLAYPAAAHFAAGELKAICVGSHWHRTQVGMVKTAGPAMEWKEAKEIAREIFKDVRRVWDALP